MPPPALLHNDIRPPSPEAVHVGSPWVTLALLLVETGDGERTRRSRKQEKLFHAKCAKEREGREEKIDPAPCYSFVIFLTFAAFA
jgi:hypothetical protein